MQTPRLALVAAFALALAALPSGAFAATTPLPNLVVNGDAEQGVATDEGGIVPTPGWTTTAGDFTEVVYGGGFPGPDIAAKIGGGKQFFAGGPYPDNGISSGTQVVNVATYAAAIDARTEPVTLSALLGGYSSQNDSATVSATFLDANNAPLGTALSIGGVDAAARKSESNLLPVSTAGTVPAGTRAISLVMTMTRTDGAYDDGYVDNVSLTLGKEAPATPPAPVPGAPVKAPGPPDVALQTGPGGSFRIQVQYIVPTACTKGCAAHAQLRIRTGGRLYAVTLPGDSPIVLGTRNGLIVPAHKKVRFYLTVSKAALLSSPFTTIGANRVAETRLRVWVKTPKGQILSVRDGHIKVSIARIKSGALPGLKGIL